MAFDFYAACNALAARFAPGTIATPTGETAMQASYGQAPDNLQRSPAVVIEPTDGQLIYESGDKRGEYNAEAHFYLAPVSKGYKRIETSRQRWLPVLLAACDGQMQLGLGGTGTVQKVIPMRWEFRVLTYGGQDFDGIVIHERIYTTEPVTLVP